MLDGWIDEGMFRDKWMDRLREGGREREGERDGWVVEQMDGGREGWIMEGGEGGKNNS